MKIVHNEDYYKLKCIEYFFNNGLVVCGNQATECRYYDLMIFYYEDRRYGITIHNIEWKILYKNKEHFLKTFKVMLKKVKLEKFGDKGE